MGWLRATTGGVHGLGGAVRHGWLAHSLLQAALFSPPRPFKLTWALTFRCHHRCTSCRIWARDKGLELTADQFGRVLASLPSLRWLDLTGGEMTARRDIAELGRQLQRHAPKLAMLHFPTGGALPEATVAAVRALQWPGGPRVVVTVSFDGPAAVHDQLRGVPGAFERACETWRQLAALPQVALFAGFTAQPGNVDQLAATVAALQAALPDFSVAQLHVNVMHRSPHYFGNTDLPGLDTHSALQFVAQVRALKAATDPFGAVEAAYLRLLPAYLQTGRSPVPCRAAEISAYIAPDGTVFACTIDDRPVGHLADFDFDFDRLWQAHQRRAIRAAVAADRCPGCWTPCEAHPTLLTQPLAAARARAG